MRSSHLVTHRWTNRQKPSGCTARRFGPLERINTSSDGYRPRPSTALSRIQTPRPSFCLRFKNTSGKNWVSDDLDAAEVNVHHKPDEAEGGRVIHLSSIRSSGEEQPQRAKPGDEEWSASG